MIKEKLSFLISKRVEAQKLDTKELQENREKFLGWLLANYGKSLKGKKVPLKYGKGFNYFSTQDSIMTCEMYPKEEGVIKSKLNLCFYSLHRS